MTTFSFHRRYHNYTGGHQKFADYLGHTLAYSGSSAVLYLDNQSPLEPELFLDIPNVEYQKRYAPQLADVAFLAGMDWRDYLPHFDSEQPKVNLIQHVRHADPAHPLFQFLPHKAVRLCVSQAVQDAIKPYAYGPTFVIKMGHQIPQINAKKNTDVYILGNKQPELAKALAEWARALSLQVVIHDSYVAKSSVLNAMAASRVSVVLPNPTEGFYLPGIEAMALAEWAVVPDCIASREYTLAGLNITGCDLTLSGCQAGIKEAMQANQRFSARIPRWRGRRLAKHYSLIQERQSYHKILGQLQQLWDST